MSWQPVTLARKVGTDEHPWVSEFTEDHRDLEFEVYYPASAVGPLIEAIDFEIGCMRHFQHEKGGQLGKLAGEIAEPLERALAAFKAQTESGGDDG